ncbi:hypothetical protein ACHAWF_014656 [Thalassiosira exigua]
MAAAVMEEHYRQRRLQRPHIQRDLFLFGAFAAFGQYDGAQDFLAVSLEDVQRNMDLFGFGGNSKIHYVKGLFSDSTK